MTHPSPALFAALLWLAAPAFAAEPRFSYQGLPPVLAGQTLQQAERALGARLEAAPGKAEARCQRRSTASRPGVLFVVDAGEVARIETRDPRYASISGVRVGDDVAKARRVYAGRLSTAAHLYFEKGLTLAVYSPDRRYALVMESNDEGRIITLRAGAVPAVERLEGCSP